MEDNVTLQEGLEIFQEKNAQYFTQRPMSEQGSAFMRSHDIAHVVFGCDTSVYGEGVVKLWSSFGTTAGFWKVVTGYNEVNAFALFKQYSKYADLRDQKRVQHPCFVNISVFNFRFFSCCDKDSNDPEGSRPVREDRSHA